MPPSVHSSGTTASAPAGTGAPVMIRTRQAGLHRVRRLRAGGDVADDRQLHRGRLAGRRDIGHPHGVAVHRGVVERRQVDLGGHGLGEHAAVRVEQLEVERRDRLDAGEDVGQVLVDALRGRSLAQLRPSTKLAQPGAEVRPEVVTLARQPHHGLEVVEPVAGVVAPAAEHDAVHRAVLAGRGHRAQRVGELDLAAPAGGVSRSTSNTPGDST